MALSAHFLQRLPLVPFSRYCSSSALLSLRRCQSQQRMFTLRCQNARLLHAFLGGNGLGRHVKIQPRSKDEGISVAEEGNGGKESQQNGALFERPPDDRIVVVELHKEATDSYLAYVMSVLLGRALLDVRDGLKPVHCRNSDLGKFHPHGDATVYDALVRKAHQIYAMLEKMSWEMKVAGYLSDAEHVLSERESKSIPLPHCTRFIQDCCNANCCERGKAVPSL